MKDKHDTRTSSFDFKDSVFSIKDLEDARKKVDELPFQTFAGMKVVCNPYLEPNEVVIMVGSEYMRKLEEKKTVYKHNITDMIV